MRPIIQQLTHNFSLAFMTTVVGLPLSTILRTALLVTNAHLQSTARAYPLLVHGEGD